MSDQPDKSKNERSEEDANKVALSPAIRLWHLLVSHSDAQIVATNVGWLMLEKVVRLILVLTIGAWVARHLGPSGFGKLSYAVSLIAIFQGVASLGADGVIVRDLARNPGQVAEILGTTFRLRLLISTFCWTFSTAAVALLRPHDYEAIILTSIIGLGLIFQSASTVDLWFQSQGRNALSVSAKLMAYCASNLVRIGMLLADCPLWAFALALLVDAVFLGFALAVVYWRFPLAQKWSFSWYRAKGMVIETWPFMVSSLAVLVYMRLDHVMIREMLGEHALGLYSAIVPLSEIWSVIPVTLATALAPYIAQKKVENEEDYLEALNRIFRVFAGISVLATTLTVLLAKPIVLLLYGSLYESAVTVLALHVCSNIFVFLGVAQSIWIINEGRGRITLYGTGLGAVVSLLGNWLLIPRFGLMGSAVTAVMAQLVASIAFSALYAPQILRMQLLAFVPSLNWLRRGP